MKKRRAIEGLKRFYARSWKGFLAWNLLMRRGFQGGQCHGSDPERPESRRGPFR